MRNFSMRLKQRALRMRGRFADESGVAGLLIAGLIAIIGFTAITVYLRGYLADREFARATSGGTRQGPLEQAIMAYYLDQSVVPRQLPCPDTSPTPDGLADACATLTTGVLPWRTLNIPREAAIDGYGNFYTYAVSAVARNMCDTITGDLAGATNTTTYTGALIDATDLSYQDAVGTTRNVAFAIIGHGANGLGAISSTGAPRAAPFEDSLEEANADAAPATIYGGPQSREVGEDYFDDEVLVPSLTGLRNVCGQLTPGGALNRDIGESFEGQTGIPTTLAATNVTNVAPAAQGGGNRVASFNGTTSNLATAATFNFTALVRPVYVASVWTPNATATSTHAGMSIATRATLADLDGGTPTDIFDQGTERGLTFRFYQPDAFAANDNIANTAGRANTISILSSDAAPVTSGADTYQLINGATYLIEAYDSGTDVWMRITQRDDAANTATLRATTSEDSLGGEQRVVFINDFDTGGTTSVSYIDDLVVGLPMLALETGPTTGIARTAAAANGTTADGNLTLEAWVKAKALPAAGERGAIISQWDTTGGNGDQSFRLYFDGDNEGKLAFDIGTTAGVTPNVESFDLGFIPTRETWSHLAVSFDNTNNRVSFYLNGELRRTASSSAAATTGVRQAQEPFSVGASLANATTAVDIFHGTISDVRVWSSIRSAAEVRDNFQRRLSMAGTEGALVVNWRFDSESGTVGNAEDVQAAPSSAADGQLTGAAYVPALAVYFRPFSTSFCPAGTRVGPYQCDFRATASTGVDTDFTVPDNLASIYAKVWGAGGGGFNPTGTTSDTAGGAGGFSQGRVQQVGSPLVNVAGQLVDIYVGGYGTGSTDTNAAGGGGGGSGLYTTGGVAAVVAGGGGGGSYSNDDVGAAGGDTCAGLVDETRCGLGGNGGGHLALTLRANAANALCGGRGGDNTPSGDDPPTTGGDCDDGGGDSDEHLGGPTTGTRTGGAGGGPTFIAGGQGYDANDADGAHSGSAVGGGGGGGGETGGEAGGYDDNSNTTGYGGGGGSGTAGAGVANAAGTAGSYVYSTGFSDATRTGTYGSGSRVVSGIAPSLAGAPIWVAGCTISAPQVGTGNNNVIESIDSTSQITLEDFPIGPAAPHTETLNVTCAGTLTSAAGGNTDPFYSPSYLGVSMQNPGRGGTTGDGNGGAIVVLW